MLLSIEMIEAKRRSERGRLQAQESLRSTQAQLEKATQSAMISELSASIVHEISQPISAMAANGQACLNWLEAEPPHLDEARIATRCVVRDGDDAAEIITGLRSLFRQAPPEKMPLAVAAVIAEVASLLRARLERENVRLELGIPEPFPLVPADKTQLQQVLVNLATNGVDAMQHTVGRPKVLVIRAQRDAGSALFEIEDCGAGVADFDTIFDSFFTTKQTGLGMGLSICRTIVEKHGGRIWGKPSPTGGTVFSFTLPLG
jgi:C4-dicarboxylate-specific signal transduction histidine kinase